MNINKIFKFIIAGIIAFIFLNILCIFYYINPNSIPTTSGVTDFSWEQSAYYSIMIEGYGHGKMNNEGYNNLQNYYNQPIEILLMGSSHMEAFQIPQNKSTAAVLNELFNNSKYVYNIGISEHDFSHIINNLEAAVQFYKPSEYVILEIPKLEFDIPAMEQGINSNLTKLSSHDSKLISLLKKIPYLYKIPYLRLIKLQYQYYKDNSGNNDFIEKKDTNMNNDIYSQTIKAVIMKLSRVANEYNIKIILLYHSPFRINFDGSIFDTTNINLLSLYTNLCAENNILFLNMTDKFKEEYETSHISPYGFLNTAINEGHLNRFGHQMIANELFKHIYLLEKEGINK